MNPVFLDYLLIIAFLIFLIYVYVKNILGIHTFSDFFNGGGNLHWIWIAVSLLGTNIQIEYILASASNGFTHGLALGSFEWVGSFVLIYTAIYIVPFFLTAGVKTLPEYLEYRYDKHLRMIYALLFMLINLIMIMLILNSSATFLDKLFNIPAEVTIPIVSVAGGFIIYFGGMKGKLRLDMVVISSFLFSGVAVLLFCFIETDGIKNFYEHADGRLVGVLPSNDKVLPWTAVITGITVSATFYFGFFPPIAQSFLASNSLSEAQKGLLFASSVKLILPFIMIIPGIVGYELFSDQISHPDFTLPVVIQNVVPVGLQGLILTGYLGTLFTTYNSFLNSTASIFTLDVVSKVSNKNPADDRLIKIKQKFIPIFVIVSILFGTLFKPSDVIFHYSQLLISSVAPIITSVFIFAIYSRKTPTIAAYLSTILGFPIFYYLESYLDISLQNLCGLVFLILCLLMLSIRLVFPLKEKVTMPERLKVKFERNLAVIIWGIFILTVGASIYAILI